MKYIRQSIDTRMVVILAVFLCAGIIFYGSRCFTTKVCGVIAVDRLVRDEVRITLPKGSILAERVDTQASRELGLSGRKSLPEEKGMLFDFGIPGKYGFWMKDMIIPIHILWLNTNLQIVHIEKGVATSTYPNIFFPKRPARFVLEVASGTVSFLGLKVGDSVATSTID